MARRSYLIIIIEPLWCNILCIIGARNFYSISYKSSRMLDPITVKAHCSSSAKWLCSLDWANVILSLNALLHNNWRSDTAYHTSFWYDGLNKPGDAYQDIRWMFYIILLICITYRLNMITLWIQYKYNILRSKSYCSRFWTALSAVNTQLLWAGMSISTRNQIIWTKMRSRAKAEGNKSCILLIPGINISTNVLELA